MITFSDSIFLFSKDNSEFSFKQIIKSIACLSSLSLSDYFPFPLKGGLAYGEATVDSLNNIYFGEAIIDAYEMEQEVHYLGTVAHHSIDTYLVNIKISNVDIELPILKTPLKSGTITHRNININFAYEDFITPLSHIKSDSFKPLSTRIGEMYLNVSGKTRLYLDNTFKVLEQLEKIEITQEN